MATVHYVDVAFIKVNKATGLPVLKDDPTQSLAAHMTVNDHEHRVLPGKDAAGAILTNSINYPTVKKYLELEAASGYSLQYMDQNKIITYSS